MSEPLLAGLERLPPRIRRFVVALGALLALGAVMAALTLTAPQGDNKRRLTPASPAATSSPRTPARRLPPPVSTAALLQARRLAERFLAGYVQFVYGRGSAPAVQGVTPSLRRQLLRGWAQLTPAERQLRPHFVSLQMVGTMPALVVATAVIADGGVATYRLRFTLQRAAGRWAVSGIVEG